VAETVDAFVGERATIKWPNDVLVDGKKIAGILTTNSLGPNGQAQITGIGLNVSTTATDLPSTGTSLAVLTGSAPHLDEVLETLFVHLNQALVLANDLDKHYLATLVEPRLAFQGEEVTVQDGGRAVTGTLAGLDVDGALRLSQPDGSTARIVAGDLTRGPRRSD
jgi:BirA family biotin operon repressor/biotin-[acetyl-CoA-carboxylase] ligase